jgi:regulator of sigma E protease
MSVFYILGAILGLGLLIIVHEAGHFVIARLCGMRVERFSIGFGPGLLRWKSKGGTLFQVAPIPFGGFVEIKGMAIAEDVEPDDKHAYPNRPVWQRIATIFAGPATNWLTAILMAFILFTCAGMPESTAYYGVDQLDPAFDAAGKLQSGDRLVAINGSPVYFIGPDGKRTELCTITSKLDGKPARISIIRAGKPMDVEVVPRYDEVKGEKVNPDLPKECNGPRYRLGINGYRAQRDRVDVGVFSAAGNAITWPAEIAYGHVNGLIKVISGQVEGQLVGPVGITSTIKKEIESGWISGMQMLIFLNVVLAIMNLLPLPGLDGGRLAFLGYELVTRRRANAKVETTVHMVGIMILMVVLVMVTFKECRAMF